MIRFFVGLVVWGWLLMDGVLVAGEQRALTNPKTEKQLVDRMDFSNEYIMGKSVESGAVYLMHRKKNEIKSLLKMRENYREEILEDIQVQRQIPGNP